jgi:hypothetical protein
VEPFKPALEVIAGVMRDGVATHPDNDWVRAGVYRSLICGTEGHNERASEKP